MKKVFFVLFITLIVNFSLTNLAPAQASRQFLSLSDEILENLWKFRPVDATERGMHKYDDRLTDFSPEAIRKELTLLKGFEKKLSQIKYEELSIDEKIDFKLVKSNVDVAILNYDKIKWWQKSPVVYVDECINGIYFLLLRDFAPLKQRAESVAKRMEKVPQLLKQGKLNIKNPPRIYVEIALGETTEGISFFEQSTQSLSEKLPELKESLISAKTKAVEAMNDYLVYLKGIFPNAKGNFAIGKEYFNYKLKNEHFLDFDSDSLLKIGENVLKQTKLKKKQLEEELKKEPPKKEEDFFVLDCLKKQDVLDYYQWEIDKIRDYLKENKIITITDNFGKCIPVETPKFMRGIIPGIAYQQPAPFDSVQTGYFYVRPVPDTFTLEQRKRYFGTIHRRGFKGSVVHEAFPGHHLQLTLGNMVKSKVRKQQLNNVLAEGWALYCEEMAWEQGIYTGNQKERYIGVLGGVAFRAARIVVDVKLHTGQFTYNQAVDFMIKELDADSSYILPEVRRYCNEPTQPMSYLVGKLIIMDMREKMKEKEKANFSLQKFHDAILSEGTIPPNLIKWKLGL
jgi:uncharacterized protein (DUF885 family)